MRRGSQLFSAASSLDLCEEEHFLKGEDLVEEDEPVSGCGASGRLGEMLEGGVGQVLDARLLVGQQRL